MDQRHGGMSVAHLVEAVPDQVVVVIVGAAGDDDFGTRRDERLTFGPLARGDEVSAVDHRGGQVLVIDLGASARPPGRAGVAFVVTRCFVAQEFEGVPPLDQRVALRSQSFQFDGPDLRAVLGLLASTLRLLVAVALALDAIDRAGVSPLVCRAETRLRRRNRPPKTPVFQATNRALGGLQVAPRSKDRQVALDNPARRAASSNPRSNGARTPGTPGRDATAPASRRRECRASPQSSSRRRCDRARRA